MLQIILIESSMDCPPKISVPMKMHPSKLEKEKTSTNQQFLLVSMSILYNFGGVHVLEYVFVNGEVVAKKTRRWESLPGKAASSPKSLPPLTSNIPELPNTLGLEVFGPQKPYPKDQTSAGMTGRAWKLKMRNIQERNLLLVFGVHVQVQYVSFRGCIFD